MVIIELNIAGSQIMNEVGDIDWGIVNNTPTISITDNAHSHDDRYYIRADVDSRISSLTTAVDDLEIKVIDLFG